MQYNGAIRQPLSRNVAEASGVRSITSLTGAEANRYVSSVRIDKIARMERLLADDRPGAGLRPPRWPEDMLGPIDRASAAHGAVLYAQLCAGCHQPRQGTLAAGTSQLAEVAVTMVRLERIRTDPRTAVHFATRRAQVALTSDRTIWAAEGLQEVTERVIERWFARNGTSPAGQRAMTGERRNRWPSPLAYRARTLDGIWATRNEGHSFKDAPGRSGILGPELTEQQRWGLVEFMKTL